MMTDSPETIKRINEINESLERLEALKDDLLKELEQIETQTSGTDDEQLYVEYRNGVPVKYAYGAPWVAQALWIDNIGYDTPEDAVNAWKMRGEK